VLLPDHGFGFTDVVKLPSPNASTLRPADFAEWAPRLRERLAPCRPRVVCFHGTMAYRPFARYGLGLPDTPVELGPQTVEIGPSRIFVVPNPSPANAHFRPEDQTAWYDRLADFLDGIGYD